MPKPTYKQTWSPIDVFGLLNGLSTWDDQYRNLKYCRRPYDGVVDMKDRLYRQHENIPSVTKQGLLNGLCNEFLLEPYNVINKKTFELTYEPEVSGTLSGVVDVLCYYKPIDSDTWTQLQPQVWNQDYEYYKGIGSGYIVWQKDRYNNIPNNKNFSYSNLVEVFEDLENETQLKFVYYRTLIDSNNDKQLVLYTDIQNPEDSNDIRYTYLKPEVPNISGDILVYNLDDIPSGIYDTFYNASGQAKQFVYDIKEYLDRKYSHTWGKLQDNSAIWDVEKNYGSGEISHFYDAVTPPKGSGEDCNITGYFTGGIEPCHNTLYMDGLEEVESGQRQLWLPKLYPGKFYVNGYSYYFFENPQIENISFANGTGLLPSGIEN
jgi:hypothetical protein